MLTPTMRGEKEDWDEAHDERLAMENASKISRTYLQHNLRL